MFAVTVIVGLAFLFVVYKLMSAPAAPAITADSPEALPGGVDVLNATLWDVKKGGVFTITGFNSDYDDADLIVDQVDRIGQGGRVVSRELKIHHEGRERWISVEKSGGSVSVSVTEPKSPRLSELGLDEDRLAEMDESQAGEFDWDGTTWSYTGSGERFWFENDGRQSEGFYYWEFESADGERYLSMSKFEGEPFEVSLSRALGDEHEISILKVA